MKLWMCGFVAATAAMAQDGSIGGATLGFVYDPQAAAVRQLTGVPGAATLGAAVADAAGLTRVAVSAVRGDALGIDAGGNAVLAAGGRRVSLGRAGKAALSASGSAAALYRSETGAIEILTGLPDAPRTARSFAVEAAPDALAVTDDGSAALVLMRAKRGGETLAWAGADGAVTTVHRARRILSIGFADGGAAALVAEPDAVKLVGPAFGAQVVADGFTDVTAAEISADGSRIAIAMRSGAVVVQDRKSGARSTAQCGCAPEGLAALRGKAVFEVKRSGEGPLWLLDADSAEPRVLFVAAPAGGAQ